MNTNESRRKEEKNKYEKKALVDAFSQVAKQEEEEEE